MNPTPSNAFSSPAGGGGSKRAETPSLVSLLRPMQAQLEQTGDDWRLQMSPMRAVDALSSWAPPEDGRESRILVLDVHQLAWRDERKELSVAAIAERLGIPITTRFDDDCIELTRTGAIGLLGMLVAARVVLVEVDGPIEGRDAEAIHQAIRSGESPLDAELRATRAMFVHDDRAVTLLARSQETALSLVAANLGQYLAAVLQTRPESIRPAELWQLERLFSMTGTMTIRPIETDVSSGSVDVGISTNPEKFGKPADASLIYDRPSNTWHDEP